MPVTQDDWPSFWQARAAPHHETIASLNTNFEQAFKAIGDLEAWASLDDRRKEHESTEESYELRCKRFALLYAYYASRTVEPFCRACHQHWSNGDFVSFCLTGRLVFEYAASIHCALAIVMQSVSDENWEQGYSRFTPLLLGTRRPYWLRLDNAEQPKSVNILTQIKHWCSQNPDADDDYAFLSEACHPNHLQHYYFYKAGSSGDLYTSLTTEQMIKDALNRIVTVVHKATVSIESNLDNISSIVKPVWWEQE